ncbi:MAG TPA: hypothetical protein VFT08_02830 [Pyrinomonadaceae bacterium]|nr:hypothetical protein [Pyrinomonadaceae bacterium]
MRFNVLVVIAIALISLRTIAAQEPEESLEGFMHGIRPNAVKGDVFYQRNDAVFPVEPGLRLEKGDLIKTSSNAYAELLLQPGNYLRIAGDTELQIINDEHDRMRLKLNRGTISLEILSRENLGSFFSGYEARYLIRVMTPGPGVFISEPGVFRIKAMSDRLTELVVRNGSAVIRGKEVKAKRQAVASRENIAINEIDSKIEDPFDVWARERADTLVRTNKALKKTAGWSKKQKESKEASVDLPEEEGTSSSSLIVSAKPGAVSYVDDGVDIGRVKNEWRELKENAHLETGDRLRTADNSFAEIALFPDMNFRIRGGSEVMFEELSNDGISIQVMNGSAILDVARFDRKKLPPIKISGPTTSVTIADTGNYRIDTSPNDAASNNDEIIVRDGKVMFNGRSVGSCRSVYISRQGDVVLNCDKNRTDDFDYWSHYRGEGEYYNGLSMAGYLAKLRRIRFRNAGFWFQSAGETSCTFVPFTSEMYRSPYGGNYSTVLSPRRRLNRGGVDVFRVPRLPSQQPIKP